MEHSTICHNLSTVCYCNTCRSYMRRCTRRFQLENPLNLNEVLWTNLQWKNTVHLPFASRNEVDENRIDRNIKARNNDPSFPQIEYPICYKLGISPAKSGVCCVYTWSVTITLRHSHTSASHTYSSFSPPGCHNSRKIRWEKSTHCQRSHKAQYTTVGSCWEGSRRC